MDSIEVLQELASQVRNAKQEGENTAERVGRLLEGIVERLGGGYFTLQTDANGMTYLHTEYSLAVMGGLTTFARSSAVVPSIFEGIPIDNDTIYWDESTGVRILKAKGSGGGSDFGATAMWEALSAATNEQINKSHLTTALSEYATTTELNTKWTQDNDKITSWDNAVSKAHEHANKATLDKIYEKDGNILIDGNVLVTGGITAYSDGSGSGGSGGGGIDVDVLWEILGGTGTQQINVTHLTDALTWNNISSKPSWIGLTKPVYSWSEITEKPTTWSWSNITNKPTTLSGYGITDAYTKTESDNRFVNVSGDTMTGDLTIQRLTISHSNEINSSDYVYLGYRDTINGVNVCFNNKPFTYGSSRYTVWHAGNDGHGSGLDADLLDGKHANSFITYDNLAVDNEDDAYASMFNSTAFYRVINTSTGGADGYIQAFRWQGGNYITQIYYDVDPTYNVSIRYRNRDNAWTSWKQFAFLDSNVASATKLQTARTIWGQSFDGTGNVSGELSQCTRIYNAANNPIYIGNSNNSSWVYTQDIASSSGNDKWTINVNGSAWFKKVNIGYTYSVEGAHLLNVEGTARANSFAGTNIKIECDNNGVSGSRNGEINNYNDSLYLQYNTNNHLVCCNGGGNLGIGTPSPSQKLDVNGNININGYLLPLVNNKGIYIRNQATWHSGIGYDTTNNECMAFGVQNVNTKFKFKVGFDWSTFIGGGSYSNMSNADLEIGAGYVSMSLGYSSQTLRFENSNEINCYQGI